MAETTQLQELIMELEESPTRIGNNDDPYGRARRDIAKRLREILAQMDAPAPPRRPDSELASTDEILAAGRSAPVDATATATEPLPTERKSETELLIEQQLAARVFDWPDHFARENGNYFNVCVHCQRQFIGHKRSVVCRVCADPIVTATRERLAQATAALDRADTIVKNASDLVHRTSPGGGVHVPTLTECSAALQNLIGLIGRVRAFLSLGGQ